MSISDKLTRLSNARDDIIDALATKGVSATGHGFEAFSTDIINIPADTPTLQTKTKTYTPTESQQTETITSDNGYDGLSSVDVTVNAVSSTYVGSGIERKSSTDLTVSGATITAPAGYYSSSASKSVLSMTLPNVMSIAASGYTLKDTVNRSSSNQYINIPAGYNSTASYYHINPVADLVLPTSASSSATSSYTSKATISRSTSDQYINIGTGYNSAGAYYKISATPNMTLPTSASSTSSGTSKATIGRSTSNQYINIPTGYNDTASYYTISAVANGSATPATSISGTSATVSTGTNTLTLTKSISNTPVVSAGYISSGTAGNSSVSLTANVTTKAAATINTSSSDQTIASGTYLTGLQTIKAVTTNNITAANIKSGVTVTVGDANNASRILSVTGTYSGISVPDASIAAGTYFFRNPPSYPSSSQVTVSLNFTSFGNSYTGIIFDATNSTIKFTQSGGTSTTVYSSSSWVNIRYRYIVIASNTTVNATEAVTFFTNCRKTSYNLLRSVTATVSTSSTTATQLTDAQLSSNDGDYILLDTSAFSSDMILYVCIRDSAGKRDGYFLGSDNYFYNYRAANSSTSALTYGGRLIHIYASTGFSTYIGATTTGYGVYAYSINTSGQLVIYSRYNSSNSRTINGTYNIRAYSLEYSASQGNPFNYT